MIRSEYTKYRSHFTIYSFIFTINNLQVRVFSSALMVLSWRVMCYTALPSTLHQEQDSHAQTKSTTFELKSLNICFSASRVSAKSKSIPQQRELLAEFHRCIDYPFQHKATNPQKQCKVMAFHWNTNKQKKINHDLLPSLTHKTKTQRESPFHRHPNWKRPHSTWYL